MLHKMVCMDTHPISIGVLDRGATGMGAAPVRPGRERAGEGMTYPLFCARILTRAMACAPFKTDPKITPIGASFQEGIKNLSS
jgi:hypothetical protein